MLLVLALLSCATKVTPVENIMTQSIATAGVQDPELASLLEEHWDATMRRWPTWATQLGDHRFDDQLPDNRPET